MKILVIIPTYNESKTIQKIVHKIFSINKNYNILIVDDASPDGTRLIVEQMQKENPGLFLLNREKKEGIGTAYCAGFKWAIDNGYEKVIQIDADLSHNPDDIPILIEHSEKYDLVIGSRYKKGVNVVNWPMHRLLLSYFANLYARFLIGIPINDLTGGFKCFKSNYSK